MAIPRTKKTLRKKGVEKFNISIPQELSEWIDQHAGTEWGARSAFISKLIALHREEDRKKSGFYEPLIADQRAHLAKKNGNEKAAFIEEIGEDLKKINRPDLAAKLKKKF